jgi:hypothetical protein
MSKPHISNVQVHKPDGRATEPQTSPLPDAVKREDKERSQRLYWIAMLTWIGAFLIMAIYSLVDLIWSFFRNRG